MAKVRVNLTLDKEIISQAKKDGVNLSARVTELLEDDYSEHKVTISVSTELKQKYIEVLSITNSTDEEFAPYLDEALSNFVKDHADSITSKMDKLAKPIKKSRRK